MIAQICFVAAFALGVAGCVSGRAHKAMAPGADPEDFVLNLDDDNGPGGINFLSPANEPASAARNVPDFAFMAAPAEDADDSEALFPPVPGSLDDAIGKPEVAGAAGLPVAPAKKRFSQSKDLPAAH